MKWFGAVFGVIWLRVNLQRDSGAKDGLVPRDFRATVDFAQRPAFAFALFALLLALAGCNDYGNTFQNPWLTEEQKEFYANLWRRQKPIAVLGHCIYLYNAP